MTVNKERITALSITMHEKNTAMQNIHELRQGTQKGCWTGESEAAYQIARVEYYRAKNALDRAIGEEANN